MKTNKLILVMSVMMLNTACFQMQKNTSEEQASSAPIEDQGPVVQGVNCEFHSPENIQGTLRTILGISSGDTAILNDQGTATNERYINKYRAALGGGVVEEKNCTTFKYKLASEIMINACAEAMGNQVVKSRLFPQGLNDLRPLYLSFLGRAPSQVEEQEIRSLVEAVSSQVAEAAACAAVASSVEALGRNF